MVRSDPPPLPLFVGQETPRTGPPLSLGPKQPCAPPLAAAPLHQDQSPIPSLYELLESMPLESPDEPQGAALDPFIAFLPDDPTPQHYLAKPFKPQHPGLQPPPLANPRLLGLDAAAAAACPVPLADLQATGPQGETSLQDGRRAQCSGRPWMYQRKEPYEDPVQEKRRRNAINAKKNREADKVRREELRRLLAVASEALNKLRREVAELRRREATLLGECRACPPPA